MALFTLEDITAGPLDRVPPYDGYDGVGFLVQTKNRGVARVRVPGTQDARPEAVLAAINELVARLGRPVVEGRMLAVNGLELTTGYAA